MSATQQRGFDDHLEHSEARARDRVVGGFLVRRQADAVGERRGNSIAVRGDVQRVPAREPELQRERGCQQNRERRR